jgi:plastocyanin
MGRGALITLVLFGALAVPASAADHAVTVSDFAFTDANGGPNTTVTQGDSVTWTFASPNHTVTSDDATKQGSFESDPGAATTPNHVPPNDKFSKEMNFPGEYAYHCRIHSNMTGKITVNPKINDPNPPPQDIVAPKFGTPTVAVTRRTAKFTLDEDAQVSAKLRGPTRKVLKLAGKSGPNVLKLPKKLKPGRYALSLRATDPAGNASTVARVKFRVPKPKR